MVSFAADKITHRRAASRGPMNLQPQTRPAVSRFHSGHAYVAAPKRVSPGPTRATGLRFARDAVASVVVLAPRGHSPQDRPKALPVARKRVFNLGRHLSVDLALHDVVALQFAEMLGEHLLGRARDELLQLIEALGAAFEVKEDEGLPFATDDVGGALHRAIHVFHQITPAGTWYPEGAYYMNQYFSVKCRVWPAANAREPGAADL